VNKRKTGSLLEDKACAILENQNFKIICRNYRAGKIGEIDIVAREHDYICFIEVKGRKDDAFGLPAESVDYKKRKRIRLVSDIFMASNKLYNKNVRFDVLELIYEKEGNSIRIKDYNLIRNAF
jgi:putative endonuclease